MSDPKTVLLVEDHPATARAYGDFIATARGFRVITALTLAAALGFCGTPGLALALVDLGLPDGEGHDLVRRLARCDPPVPAVVITNRDDRRSLMAAVHAGAKGYVLKDEDPAFVLQVVDEALRGEVPLSGRMAGTVLELLRHEQPEPPAVPLTPRERDLLQLFAKGMTYGECASLMGIALGTVQDHVKRLYPKLGVSTKAEATALAIQCGLVEA